MKVIMLAGGLGTRLTEETALKPKPMIEIGGFPILWHIMKIYSFYGFNEFVIALGYKGNLIKEYFLNYSEKLSDLTIDYKNNQIIKHQEVNENWIVNLISTGNKSFTGTRLKKAMEFGRQTSPMLRRKLISSIAQKIKKRNIKYPTILFHC